MSTPITLGLTPNFRAEQPPRARGSARATAVLSFGLVVNLAALMTFAATLHEIAGDWSLNASESGWIGGIYFAGYAIAVPFMASATVPPERGIFLSKTRRMHPNLCRFVSDAFYDGRLMPEAGNERQSLMLDQNADPALVSTGLGFIPVEHEGCSQRSEPEAERITALYRSLLDQRWTDQENRV